MSPWLQTPMMPSCFGHSLGLPRCEPTSPRSGPALLSSKTDPCSIPGPGSGPNGKDRRNHAFYLKVYWGGLYFGHREMHPFRVPNHWGVNDTFQLPKPPDDGHPSLPQLWPQGCLFLTGVDMEGKPKSIPSTYLQTIEVFEGHTLEKDK